MRRLQRRSAVFGTAVVLAGGVIACGGTERSISAYCEYFYGEGAELRDRYLGVREGLDSGDPLSAMAQAVAGPTELGKFLSQLAERAPEEIASDVEIMAEAMGGATDSAADSLGNPMAGLGGGLVGALASAPAAARVDRYTLEHCGPAPE